ncbi:excalibur calcium-binding domain-containing protein [Streptomyces sp. NPDC057539]|uniref:excalibur calcium-binding domain-containing protein n=1 Tax=Streptomyces sp. NPDC057539 TaxID=3346159 RepID=UPI00369B3BB6
MSQNHQPPWGQPPQPPTGPNPYLVFATPPARPKWTRKRILIPAAFLAFFIGVIAGTDAPAQTENAASAKAVPEATVTATTTVTTTPAPAATQTVTASPEPAPTVTKTKTVRVTVAPDAGSGGSGDDNGTSGGSGSTYYANCTAVRAAGADPIYAGEPGYGRHLDRDGDGVACE